MEIETMVTTATDGVASSMDYSVPMGERLLLGLETTLLGMGTVFAVLIILMGVLYLFRVFFYTIPNRRRGKKKVTETEATATDAVSQEDAGSREEDGAAIAAITAAIAAYLEAEAQSATPAGLDAAPAKAPVFRVVDFRRK